ncbi:hypothetical protein [Streptomyces sp. NPDC029526]|uniref:hypothetical protein n=1 Tax=Streptomyces sp. NPDC029526 TaxID=3155728 RepID=UPI0033C45B8D
MRPCLPAACCLVAAATVLPVAGTSAAAAPADALPATVACAAAGDREFPLTTRLHGGPGTYTAGGGFGVWYVDLTNTTDRTCTAVHPVIVLVDAERALKPGQATLEFYDRGRDTDADEPTDGPEKSEAPEEGNGSEEADGSDGAEKNDGPDATGTSDGAGESGATVETGAADGADATRETGGTDGTGRADGAEGRPHPVRLELTDQDELVGALADDEAGFPGFTVAPGRTLTVKLRLQFTSDAVANEVVANAAVVQRHKDDGDWVGQSNDYRFRIDAPSGTGTRDPAPDTTRDTGTTRAPSPGPHPRPGDSTGPPPATTPDGTVAADPPAPPAASEAPLADELAASGIGTRTRVLAGAAAALLTGGAAVLLARRRG